MLSCKDDCKERLELENTFIRVDGEHVFREGELFDSYEDLLRRMELHTKESLVYYWRRDSRTVERAFTKTTRTIAPRLKYYFVRFACIYGGMKTRESKRPLSQPKRTDCPAHVLLRAAKCGQKLEVISVCNDHNHEISERASQQLPQNRRLQREVREEVLEMLKLKIDRKKIIDYVRQRENKKITTKDLFNLAARLKIIDANPIVDTNKRTKILQKIYRSTTDKSISTLISNELTAVSEPDQSVYYELDNNELVEYISPDHEFGVNETIIESIVEARKREITITNDLSMRWSTDDFIVSTKNDLTDHESVEMIEDDTNTSEATDILMDDIIVDESDTIIDMKAENDNDELGTIVVYENLQNNNDAESYDNEESPITLQDSSVDNNFCSVVLYETTTGDVFNIDGKISTIDDANSYEKINDNSKHIDKNRSIKKKINSSAKRISKCRKCGSDSRLVKIQVDYLKAKRDKLLAETRLLKLKKTKLMKEMEQM